MDVLQKCRESRIDRGLLCQLEESIWKLDLFVHTVIHPPVVEETMRNLAALLTARWKENNSLFMRLILRIFCSIRIARQDEWWRWRLNHFNS